MEKEKIINLIRSYIENNNEVVFGFLFGSLVQNNASLESDIDIGLYVKQEDDRSEIELQMDLERILKKSIDLVVLNSAPATLAWAILRKGIPLVIKDRRIFINFMLEVSDEAEDFLDFNLDTYRRKYAHR